MQELRQFLLVLNISESRRPETFTMRIDKASVVILDRSRKETPSASQAGDSPRCISESRRAETLKTLYRICE